MSAFVVKSAPRPDGAEQLEFHEKSMWRGKSICPGDTVYLFAAEHNGGLGLYARGVVTRAVRGQGSRVILTVRRTSTAKRRLGRTELRASGHRAIDECEAEIAHKLYHQATNKIAGITAAAAAFLDRCF